MTNIIRKNFLNWLPLIINLIFFSFLLTIHIRLYQYAFDDAYIHFRVVRNFFEIGNPYFNSNEVLKASTSSGWILFLTILFGCAKLFNIVNNFPMLISITNASILMGELIVYSKIVEILLNKPLTIPQKLVFQITFMALLLPSSIGLMETPLALLTAGLGIYFLLEAKPSGFVFLGFAAYIRLELFIIVALAFAIVVFQKQLRIHQVIKWIILGLLPFVLFDLYYFHTLLPHSVMAKSRLYSLSTLTAIIQISFLSLPAIPFFNTPARSLGPVLFMVIVIFISWVTFRERTIRKHYWLMLFFLSSLCIVGAYIIGHILVFEWYCPLYMIPILIISFTYSFMLRYPKNIIMKVLLLFILSFSIISLFTTFYASFYNRSKFYLFESGSRVKMYLKVGKIINEEYPNAILLTSEIGGLGYSFKGEILDGAGLVSPDALEYHPMKVPDQRENGRIGAIPPEYVRKNIPDIIVSYDIFAKALMNDPIISQYNVITIPAYLPEDAIFSESKTIWGSKYLRVYIHKSLPVSSLLFALQ